MRKHLSSNNKSKMRWTNFTNFMIWIIWSGFQKNLQDFQWLIFYILIVQPPLFLPQPTLPWKIWLLTISWCLTFSQSSTILQVSSLLNQTIILNKIFQKTGHPAISIPVSTIKSDSNQFLPFSIQLSSPLHSDLKLLDISQKIETLLDFNRKEEEMVNNISW